MNFKSKQQLFDFIGEHLIRQGKQASGGTFGCAYRGKDGLKCAIGCIIPDKFYKKEMENKSVFALFAFDLPWYIQRYNKFLDRMQGVHDNVDNWFGDGRIQKVLINVGIDEGLDTAYIESINK